MKKYLFTASRRSDGETKQALLNEHNAVQTLRKFVRKAGNLEETSADLRALKVLSDVDRLNGERAIVLDTSRMRLAVQSHNE